MAHDDYIPAREEQTVVLELRVGDHVLATLNTVLEPEQEDAATELAREVVAGLGSPVELLGHREDVPEILAAADVFAFPSLWEGLGGALIEAMALGLPIVASDVPAIREVVDEGANARLVPPADPPALAEALARLLGDARLRSSYGERSREIFLERFTLERSAEAMLALYQRVVAGDRSLAAGRA